MHTLTHYLTLANATGCHDNNTLGCCLPELKSAGLRVRTIEIQSNALLAQLQQFAPESGWYMTRSQIQLGIPSDARLELIEGEWARGDSTLIIRLIDGERYQVTQTESTPAQESEFCYGEQSLFLRKGLISNQQNVARYRFWWRQGTGEQEGRWLPVMQQFIGFGSAREI